MSSTQFKRTGDEAELEWVKPEGETKDQTDYILQSAYNNRGNRPFPSDLDTLFKVLDAVVTLQSEIEGRRDVIVASSFPPIDQDKWKEIITFGVRNRQPASMKPGRPTESRGGTVYKPVFAGEVPDDQYPGHTIEVYEHRFESLICITPWAQTATEANLRSLWLENLLINDFRWAFTGNGIEELMYIEREADTTERAQPGSTLMFGCPMLFWARTKRIYHRRLKTIEQFKVMLSARTGVTFQGD